MSSRTDQISMVTCIVSRKIEKLLEDNFINCDYTDLVLGVDQKN